MTTNREPKLTFEHEYAPHELAGLLPMIDTARFVELREDIRKNGILEPILKFEGRIRQSARLRLRTSRRSRAATPRARPTSSRPTPSSANDQCAEARGH